LTAEDPVERLDAAVVLSALGREARALPVLLQSAKGSAERLQSAGRVLPWLPWPERLHTFDGLLAERPPPEEMGRIISLMALVPEKRLIPRLWDLVARGDLPEDAASEVLSALQRQYLLRGLSQFARYHAGSYGPDGAQTPDESRQIAAAKKETVEA